MLSISRMIVVLGVAFCGLALPTSSIASITWRQLDPAPSCVDTAGDAIATTTEAGPARDVQLWDATLQPLPPLALGLLADCPQVAGDRRGTLAAAGEVHTSDGRGVRVVARDANGTTVDAGSTTGVRPAVAVGSAGDVVAAWLETRERNRGESQARVQLVRRTPGGAFGPAEPVGDWFPAELPAADTILCVGVDGAGAVSVAVAHGVEGGQTVGSDDAGVVVVHQATRGAAFGAPEVQTSTRWDEPGLSLSVADDGARAIVYVTQGRLRVMDSSPAGTFGTPQALAARGTPSSPTVKITPGGGGVVTWVAASGRDGSAAAMYAAVRTGRGPFTARRRLDAVNLGVSRSDESAAFDALGAFVRLLSYGTLGLVADPTSSSIGITPDGAVTIVFGGFACPCADGDLRIAAYAARGSLQHGIGAPDALTGPTLLPGGVAVLPDGAVAVSVSEGAWSAPASETTFGAGRLGVVPPQNAEPTAASPGLRVVGVLRSRRAAQAVSVVVQCAAACDVRGIVRGRSGPLAAGSATSPGGKRFTVRLRTGVAAVPQRLRIVLRATPQGRSGPEEVQRVRATVRRVRARAPRIVGASARIVNGEVAVRFATTSPMDDGLVTIGYAGRRVEVVLPSDGTSRFAGTLPGPPPRGDRPVVVSLLPFSGNEDDATVVRLPVGR